MKFIEFFEIADVNVKPFITTRCCYNLAEVLFFRDSGEPENKYTKVFLKNGTILNVTNSYHKLKQTLTI